MFRTVAVVLCFAAMMTSASAQEIPDLQGQPLPPVPGQRPTPKPSVPVATTPVAPVEAPRKIRGRDLNIQVEITISDQVGTSAPEKKVVSLLAADQTMGRVRANANAQRGEMGFVGTELNVDARPIIIDNDRIVLELTLEYTPLRDTQVKQSPTNLNESLHVILQNGKSLTVSQAADPISDRKMTVEVKATILK